MKQILLFAIMILTALGATAQEMRVRSMRMEPMDLTAATSQRKDLNGVPCAVVKVRMPRGAAFEGSVIGTPDYRTGEYWVYVTAGSKFLRVKHESALPLHISFADHGVAPLESKATYVLDIAMPAAQARPCPREPVEISMPGHLFMEGWPWSLEPSFRSVSSSDSGKNPTAARHAYWMGQTWPLERTMRSRSGQRGFWGSTFMYLK